MLGSILGPLFVETSMSRHVPESSSPTLQDKQFKSYKEAKIWMEDCPTSQPTCTGSYRTRFWGYPMLGLAS